MVVATQDGGIKQELAVQDATPCMVPDWPRGCAGLSQLALADEATIRVWPGQFAQSESDRPDTGPATAWPTNRANASRTESPARMLRHLWCQAAFILIHLVIRPTVSINSSTFCRCSTTSPEANAPATQWET